jgi:hypothetical protein
VRGDTPTPAREELALGARDNRLDIDRSSNPSTIVVISVTNRGAHPLPLQMIASQYRKSRSHHDPLLMKRRTIASPGKPHHLALVTIRYLFFRVATRYIGLSTDGDNPMTKTFELSIETAPGKSERHGFHLGTIEAIARQIAKEKFYARRKWGYPTVTVALMRNGKLFDCYDRTWMGPGR